MSAMTWDGPFVGMDPLTLQIIVEMQLQDSEELVDSSKGKQREGTLTDAQVALQMYMEDLTQCNAYLQDRNMAQSVAMAILADGALIAEAFGEEQQAARDREMAMRLDARHHGGDTVTAGPAPRETRRSNNKSKKRKCKNPWEDAEMLEKMAAIYMKAPEEAMPDIEAISYDSDGTVAESSTWAAARKKNGKRPRKTCIACSEEMDFFEVIRVPCDHEYCRACLETLFTVSMKDESLFPPRCDKQEITLEWVRAFVSQDLAKEFEAKYEELSTKNRTYCHEPTCATFVPEESIIGDIATCPECTRTTCTMCKSPSHTGDCPEDEALRQLIDTADMNQWQRCYRCAAMVELDRGCNHMSCRCGAQFCYTCGERWKTCSCEQWDEARLMARAAQIVDRNPNRRLFQPPHVMHTQPATVRPPRTPRHASGSHSTVATVGRGRRSSVPPFFVPATSAYESDFSDRSEWEDDSWTLQDVDFPITDPESTTARQPGTVEPTTPDHITEDLVPLPPPTATATTTTTQADIIRNDRIAEAIEHLRTHHACTHDKWRYRSGRHQCEECRHVLKEYIFECRQCSLQACNRCRRNRL